jgi:hypothetical protein
MIDIGYERIVKRQHQAACLYKAINRKNEIENLEIDTYLRDGR